jgi:hypothetical protein
MLIAHKIEPSEESKKNERPGPRRGPVPRRATRSPANHYPVPTDNSRPGVVLLCSWKGKANDDNTAGSRPGAPWPAV